MWLSKKKKNSEYYTLYLYTEEVGCSCIGFFACDIFEKENIKRLYLSQFYLDVQIYVMGQNVTKEAWCGEILRERSDLHQSSRRTHRFGSGRVTRVRWLALNETAINYIVFWRHKHFETKCDIFDFFENMCSHTHIIYHKSKTTKPILKFRYGKWQGSLPKIGSVVFDLWSIISTHITFELQFCTIRVHILQLYIYTSL